ncbi:uncharacterized protein BJX67DRAFT_190869 [Aspergillus lucknowensis]|uniref:Uncharacterized protein n=1 Tax=Aspergillus lucknowensis TaxID=176173 RepID=A0ABR4LKC2_9EURO
MLLRPVNLPPSLLVPPTLILGLALYISVFRKAPIQTTSQQQLTDHHTDKDGKPLATPTPLAEILVPTPTTPRIADTNALFGTVSAALVLPYFVSSYMPIEENQFLHASVPIRLWISAMLIGNLVVRGRKHMSREGYWEFLALGVLDAVGAVALGVYLGRFDGRVGRV